MPRDGKLRCPKARSSERQPACATARDEPAETKRAEAADERIGAPNVGIERLPEAVRSNDGLDAPMAEAARCLKRREREPSDEHRRCATASSAVRQRGVPSRRQPVRRHATNRPMRKQRALAMNALARLTFDLSGVPEARPLDGNAKGLPTFWRRRRCAKIGGVRSHRSQAIEGGSPWSRLHEQRRAVKRCA